MGTNTIDPALLTSSGERCLREIGSLALEYNKALRGVNSLAVSCATAVEAHIDVVLGQLIENSGVTRSRLSRALLDECQDDIYRSWSSRLKWLNRGFEISIGGDSEVQRFLTVVDLRNILVHGHGHLTAFQTRDFRRAHDLRRRLQNHLTVQLISTRVILDSKVGWNVINTCREMVCHFDQAAIAAEPSFQS